MKSVARRGFLRGLALAPIAAPAAATAAKARLMNPWAGAAGLAGQVRLNESAEVGGGGPKIFRQFADWFGAFGEKRARRDARDVVGFDPDILELNLPMPTKVRMQRERNFQRIVARQKESFLEHMEREGKFEWWA